MLLRNSELEKQRQLESLSRASAEGAEWAMDMKKVDPPGGVAEVTAGGPSAMLLDGPGYDDDDDGDDDAGAGGTLIPLPPPSFTSGLKLAPPQVGSLLQIAIFLILYGMMAGFARKTCVPAGLSYPKGLSAPRDQPTALRLAQISGYFQWLSMIKMTVADDGHSLKALLTFLGD